QDGTVVVWGGDTNYDETHVPHDVRYVTAIAASDNASIAVTQEDQIFIWYSKWPVSKVPSEYQETFWQHALKLFVNK
ncbi:MAG: hypothetical protein ACK5C8_11330, partial [Roseiflexaceae bacterium]